jgi:hypothetical protein
MARKVLQNLASGDDMTKMLHVKHECVDLLIDMVRSKFEPSNRQCDAAKVLLLIIEIQNGSFLFTSDTKSDIAKTFVEVSLLASEPLQEFVIQDLWNLSAIENRYVSIQILTSSGAIRPILWFSVFGAGPNMKLAKSALRNLLNTVTFSPPDPFWLRCPTKAKI